MSVDRRKDATIACLGILLGMLISGSVFGDLPKPPWEMTGTPERARVYVDVSGTMAGYDRSKESAFYDFAMRMKQFLFLSGIMDLEGAGFGGKLEQVKHLNGVVDVLDWPAKEAETCLALPFLKEIDEQLEGGHDGHVMLVITDGVASAVSTACGANCAEGNDVTCVADAIYRYIGNGNGLWVVGMKLGFQGTYYPEIGSKTALPVDVPVPRPIYLWIGSQDIVVGAAIAERVLQWVVSRLSEPAGFAFEVWPGDWSGGWRTGLVDNRSYRPRDFAGPAEIHEICGGWEGLALKDFRQGGSGLTVALRGNKEKGGVWAGQIPLVPVQSYTSDLIQRLLSLRGEWPPHAEGAKFLYNMKPEKVPGQPMQERGSFCLLVEEKTATIGMRWTVKVDTSPLEEWSTYNDSKLENIGKTLNLSDLWGLVCHRLASDIDKKLTTPLLRIEVK